MKIKNKSKKLARYAVIIMTLLTLLLVSCNNQTTKEVVVYTSVDQVYSEPIFKEFEKISGIKVLPVYDVEAAKTTGLVNRLIAEKEKPQADVYWSGEFAQTITLKRLNVLQSYHSKSASDIPKQYVDSNGYWTGFGGRARVLIVNKNKLKVSNYPTSIYDLLHSEVPAEEIGLANPVFGTTSTHAAAMYALLGPEKGKEFFEKIKNKGIRIVDGNSVVRDLVADGQLTMGITDTDDAFSAIEKGAPVEIVFLDQGPSEIGTLVVPNTVAMIKGAPHPEEAKELIDYLLNVDTEQLMIKSGWIHFSVRPMNNSLNRLDIKSLNVEFEKIFNNIERSKKEMTEIFIR